MVAISRGQQSLSDPCHRKIGIKSLSFVQRFVGELQIVVLHVQQPKIGPYLGILSEDDDLRFYKAIEY